MGNWRTVHVHGSVDPADATNMIAYLGHKDEGYYWDSMAYNDGVRPLCFSDGLASLGSWVDNSGKIDASGNLAERDFSVEDVAHDCEILAAKYPSLSIQIDCGDNFESLNCVASIFCKAGTVTIEEPAVATVQPLDDTIRTDRLMAALTKFK